MEIILTVVITLMVVSLIGAVANLITLNKKIDEVDLVRNDLEIINRELDDRIDGWVSSTDRRFDKIYDEIGRLDELINPNKDIIRK